MATVTDHSSANSVVSGTTLVVPSITAAIGCALSLAVAADNNGVSGTSTTSATITDALGNTWLRQSHTIYSPGSTALDGTVLSTWSCEVTVPFAADSITVNFSGATTAKSAILKKITPDVGKRIKYKSVGAGAGATSTAVAAPSASVAVGEILIGYAAMEARTVGNPDSDTTGGTWSTEFVSMADSGGAASSQTIVGQHKIINAAGTQNYGKAVTNRDWAANWILFEEELLPGTLSFAATDAQDSASFTVPTYQRRAGTASVRILVKIVWPDADVTRLWSGNGAFITTDGEVWRGAGLIAGIAELERAVNGESPGMTATMSGVSSETSGKAWTHFKAGNLVDAELSVLLQACDDRDQPQGDPRTVFTGYFDNLIFDDEGGKDPMSAVSAEIVNKFSLRRTPNYAVLSDADQKARSAITNPGDPPDRFADRMSLNENKTITWPRFS